MALLNSRVRSNNDVDDCEHQVRDADDPDAASMVAEAHLVPRAVRSLLPNWDPEVGRRKLSQYFLVEGNFIHYNVGNPDPVLIYSKDSMHQVWHYLINYMSTNNTCMSSR